MTVVTKSPPAPGDPTDPAVAADDQQGAPPASAAPEQTAQQQQEESPPPDKPTIQVTSQVTESDEPLVPDREGDEEQEEEEGALVLPLDALTRLDEMINRPRWVVPVLPNGELEVLLKAAIRLCKAGEDTNSEACQRFFAEGLTVSFTKIMTDEAVNNWKYEIHRCIYSNAQKLVELCVTKMSQDWFPLLELLAVVFNPATKFQMFNSNRLSDSAPQNHTLKDDELFARPCPDPRIPRGWLVDLVNHFGKLGGFDLLLERFQTGSQLNVAIIAALIRPFGLCHEVLTVHTVEKYFLPVIEKITTLLKELSDNDLKKESKKEGKNESVSGVMKYLKQLAARAPGQEELVRNLEVFRLHLILRLLHVSSFNGKMNALNEVNKVIASVSYYTQQRHHPALEAEEEFLSADKMAEWISTNDVLAVVLRGSLHQPQYVEKLEKIIRFMIKEKSLGFKDLDQIWSAQAGKHEAIVKNVHDLLAKLAWDFSPEQLDHLFNRFQESWATANRKQREKLLELIRRLAEDDKEGVMATKVLGLLYNLARSEDGMTDIMDQALSAHIKILDYSCSQERDTQKMQWLNKFVDELKDNHHWVLPALKQIREICQLFAETPANYNATSSHRTTHVMYRSNVINQLQQTHTIVMLVSQNIVTYTEQARAAHKEHPDKEPTEVCPDGRYNHVQQISERLKFLKFLLKDGQLWLCEPQAKQIWKCLAENAIYRSDREACFKWFSKLMSDEPDLDPDIMKEFFENNILQLDPSLLTENGIICFDRFFKRINLKEGHLTQRRRGCVMEDINLIGLDYLWRVVLYAPEEVAEKAILLLKEVYTNLGPKLIAQQVAIHEDFIQSCMDRLRAQHDTVSALDPATELPQLTQEASRMVRVLTVLREYVAECDDAYQEERGLLPLGRACRGRQLQLTIRFHNPNRPNEDYKILAHSNETLMTLRRNIMNDIKASSAQYRLELYVNGEHQDPREDKRLVSQVPLRDKVPVSAKIVPITQQQRSSPDSSSDSEGEGTPHVSEGPNVEAEACLPGVLLSQNPACCQFLFSLSDLGANLKLPRLRDSARAVLHLMPADNATVEELHNLSRDSRAGGDGAEHKLLQFFLNKTPTQAWYNLEVLLTQLMPATNMVAENITYRDFTLSFMQAGGLGVLTTLLKRQDFLQRTDPCTRRGAFLTLLKSAKFCLLVACVSTVSSLSSGASQVSPEQKQQYQVLYASIPHIPMNYIVERSAAQQFAKLLGGEGGKVLADMEVLHVLQRLTWAAGTGDLTLMHARPDDIHDRYDKGASSLEPSAEDVAVVREGVEMMALSIACLPSSLELLQKDKHFQNFIIDMVLIQPHRGVRHACSEQFIHMVTKCSRAAAVDYRPLLFLIQLLITVLTTKVKEVSRQSDEYFQLLCRLLQSACQSGSNFHNAQHVLNRQIQWLLAVREEHVGSEGGGVEESLLAGSLNISKELLAFAAPEKKRHIGSDDEGPRLITLLLEDFLFPASTALTKSRAEGGEPPCDHRSPICHKSASITAAYDLVVALCQRCPANLKVVSHAIVDMFYSEADPPLTEWEYLPPIGPRPERGFVGLKNAGATCYMNSILQQLFMIRRIREGILSVPHVADDIEEEEAKLEEASRNEDKYQGEEKGGGEDREGERKNYNVTILKHVQNIFGHLSASKLQFFVPKGFWHQFKLWGEPVNLREQHDALEFFNCLVDSLDEGLKCHESQPICSKIMAGSFADQKICKGCPHRYQREEPFTTLNVDIRNQQNLHEALEQYVKGDLLEGANAYHCDKCDMKVDTVKRMCIKKLPPVLAMQLKRFDYDWERECAIKFNDYFGFPREIDMEPYTVQGLAKIEGDVVDPADAEVYTSTQYRLTGVVVHSGQASGGHYYSYILHRLPGDTVSRWFKFDDGEVTECRMDDDEEMKTQCFGGEYLGEVFDHMLKRMSFRRQKRWWNAYILFYQRVDCEETVEQLTDGLDALSLQPCRANLPPSIERLVRRQNMEFVHSKAHFSSEYFQFMAKLVRANHSVVTIQPGQARLARDADEIALQTVQLVSKFLFHVGFRTKKTLRGSASDWYEVLSCPLRNSVAARTWFGQTALLGSPQRFSHYLLQCPTSEVRNTFAKLVVFVAHFTRQDGPFAPPKGLYTEENPPEPDYTLSDHLLVAVIRLLEKDVPEHSRHLGQYFNLFYLYATLGTPEKQQLLRLGVPGRLMLVAVDEGPGPAIRYQYAELSKLYSVVSLLVRCCDVSQFCSTPYKEVAVLPNRYCEVQGGQPLMPVQHTVIDILFSRPGYVKKLIEDAGSQEETARLLRYCSWENPRFSWTVLTELLWQIAYAYTYEMKPHLELLLQILLMPDSWQGNRILNSLKGQQDDQDGLLVTIQRSKNHYQKRAYQCIKMMTQLFSTCPPALQLLNSNRDIKRKWGHAVRWLSQELERRQYGGANTQYYSNWSPPAQSNETSNGYFLERSDSARHTLRRALTMLPEDAVETPEGGAGYDHNSDEEEEETGDSGTEEPKLDPNASPEEDNNEAPPPLTQVHQTSGPAPVTQVNPLITPANPPAPAPHTTQQSGEALEEEGS